MAEYVVDVTNAKVITGLSDISALWGLPVHERIVRYSDCKHATDEGYGCKHFSHYEKGASYRWEDVPADVEPDGFCKWGERREVDA